MGHCGCRYPIGAHRRPELDASAYVLRRTAACDDPVAGRFLQPDSIVPDLSNPQALNRYSYVNNNPLGYVDPTGHTAFGFDNCSSTGGGCFSFGSGVGAAEAGSRGVPTPTVTPIPAPSPPGTPCPPWEVCMVSAIGELADLVWGISPFGFLSNLAANSYTAVTGKSAYTGHSVSTSQRWISGGTVIASIAGPALLAGAAAWILPAETALTAEEVATEATMLRAAELQAQLPTGSAGRVTMAVGVVQDGEGNLQTVIATSEPRGYLRPGVTTRPGEIVISGSGHAEQDIVYWAQQNDYQIVAVAAGRPTCPACVSQLASSIYWR